MFSEDESPRSSRKKNRNDNSDSDEENFFSDELYKKALDAA